MADQVIYTKKRNAQYRGPTTSDDYNDRVEENYKDLTVLANRQQALLEQLEYLKRYMIKNMSFMSTTMMNLFNEFEIFSGDETARFNNRNMFVDNDRFDDTEFAIDQVDRLEYDERYRVFTLPLIENGSFSKLKFIAMDGTEVVSPNLKVFIQPLGNVEARPENVIDANDFYNALISKTTLRGWELNSIVDGAFEGTSHFRVYVTIPDDQSLVRDSNVILFEPLYNGTFDLSNFQYTTTRNVTFTSSDNWQDFEVGQYPIIVDNRMVLPDDGETIERVNGTYFSFPPTPITGVSFEISTENYGEDTALNVYSHGLHAFDVRYNKFSDEGKVILRLDAGETAISNIESVTPVLANCSSSEVPFAFEYRTIWETAEDSEIYSLEPIALSSKVWIEITLRKTVDGGAPVMPYLLVETS